LSNLSTSLIILCHSTSDDPEYPTYKATYREFLSEGSRFKEVVPIEDEAIRAKIHQTYRLLYLKDVILARVLDDPMFNILNSLLFFNQIDIITHIANNDAFLHELFAGFKDHKTKSKAPIEKSAGTATTGELDEVEIKRRKDIVALLHQLMLMGKQVQMQHRQQLYRTLVDRGLLFVCEWALQQQDSTILNQIAEMLGIVIDHDVNAVRSHALREHAEKRRTIAEDMSSLLLSSSDLGLKSQMADAIRTLVDIGGEGSEVSTLHTRRLFRLLKISPLSYCEPGSCYVANPTRPGHRRCLSRVLLRGLYHRHVSANAGIARLQTVQEWVSTLDAPYCCHVTHTLSP
jgi:protein phosphatase-4 regulatory subunit 3